MAYTSLGADSAPSNLVYLPTAAPRQVKQPSGAAFRAARTALWAKRPWPGQYVFPVVRDAQREVRGLTPVEIALKVMMEALPLLQDVVREHLDLLDCRVSTDETRAALALVSRFGGNHG